MDSTVLIPFALRLGEIVVSDSLQIKLDTVRYTFLRKLRVSVYPLSKEITVLVSEAFFLTTTAATVAYEMVDSRSHFHHIYMIVPREGSLKSLPLFELFTSHFLL